MPGRGVKGQICGNALLFQNAPDGLERKVARVPFLAQMSQHDRYGKRLAPGQRVGQEPGGL